MLYIADKATLPHNVKTGKYVSIAAGVYFHYRDNHPCVQYREVVSTFDFGGACGWKGYYDIGGKESIEIGNDVWIGYMASILDGVKVGNGAIIAAHSVVTKDVPDYAVVAGNPARIKRYRFDSNTIDQLNEIKWWDWDQQKIIDNMETFKNVELFIDKFRK
jgi:virginiamycin A acetyltransferase